MKIASKNKSSQKGALRIIVIVGVVIAVVVIGVILLSLKGSSKLTPVNNQQNQSSSQSQGETGFDKVEGTSYIFYYPKGYVQGELQTSDRGIKDLLNYINPNTRAVVAESIFLRTESAGRKLKSPDYDSCKKYAEEFRQKGDDVITVEVARGYFGDGKGVGCKAIVKSKVTGVNDATLIVDKFLIDPQDLQGKYFAVRALYYENASKDQAEILNLAVDQFTLK